MMQKNPVFSLSSSKNLQTVALYSLVQQLIVQIKGNIVIAIYYQHICCLDFLINPRSKQLAMYLPIELQNK